MSSFGIVGDTKVGLFREDVHEDPMYLDIEELEFSKYRKVHCYDYRNNKFLVSKIKTIIKFGTTPVRSYRFSSDCNFGKSSFGAEDEIVATPNQEILTFDHGGLPLEYIEHRRPTPNSLISIKRKPYNEVVETCTSSFLISFDYNYDVVYTLVIEGDYHFVANGFLVKGWREN